MSGKYVYPYPRPMVTVDAVVFAVIENKLQLLVIKRKNDPCEGSWALPGGFVDENESLGMAVARELEEEAGLQNINLHQFETFGNPGRDPRGWTISVAFLALIDISGNVASAGDDATDVSWLPVFELSELAFDHMEIVQSAVKHLRMLAKCFGVGFNVLPDEFSLEEFKLLYDCIFDVNHEPVLLKQQMISAGILKVKEPDELYSFSLKNDKIPLCDCNLRRC